MSTLNSKRKYFWHVFFVLFPFFLSTECSTFTLCSTPRQPWSQLCSSLWLTSSPSITNWRLSWLSRCRTFLNYQRNGSWQKNNVTIFISFAPKHLNTPTTLQVHSRFTWKLLSSLTQTQRTKKRLTKTKSNMLKDWLSPQSRVQRLSTSRRFSSLMLFNSSQSNLSNCFSLSIYSFKRTFKSLRLRLRNLTNCSKRSKSPKKKQFWKSSTFKFATLRKTLVNRENKHSRRLQNCLISMKMILRSGSSKRWAMASSMQKSTSSMRR